MYHIKTFKKQVSKGTGENRAKETSNLPTGMDIPALSCPGRDTLGQPVPLPRGISLECSVSGPSNRSIWEASSEGTRRQDQLWLPRS